MARSTFELTPISPFRVDLAVWTLRRCSHVTERRFLFNWVSRSLEKPIQTSPRLRPVIPCNADTRRFVHRYLSTGVTPMAMSNFATSSPIHDGSS
jgi:hypothetical protein